MKIPLAVTTACLLFLLTGLPLTAQENQSNTVNVLQLRTRLAAAIGDHLTIVKDETAQRSNSQGGGSFWLVHVQPKHTGHFALKYRYNYNGKLYSHVERELRLRVGEQGCRRGPLGSGQYGKFCLGDTIILPIALENFTEHEFSLKVTPENVDDEDNADTSTDIRLNTTQPINPVANHLLFIGAGSNVSLHRAGGYTLERYAVFEAKQPGRFNLSLTSGGSQASDSSKLAAASFPIIVVKKETPLTAVLARENVEGFSKGFNGREYSSSSGGNTSYLTNVLILQPGDRFSFVYQTEIRSAEAEWKERAGNKLDQQSTQLPIITKLSFSFDKEWGYNEWIKDWVSGVR